MFRAVSPLVGLGLHEVCAACGREITGSGFVILDYEELGAFCDQDCGDKRFRSYLYEASEVGTFYRSQGDTSDDRIFKLQVVEKGREIESQCCNGEIFSAPELTLSVTSKIGVENVQPSSRNASTLRNQEAARLPKISADAVLKDHRTIEFGEPRFASRAT